VSDRAVALIRLATQLGKVVILTASRCNWVNISGMEYLPKLYTLIKRLKIPVVYACDFEREVYLAARSGKGYEFHLEKTTGLKECGMLKEASRFYGWFVYVSQIYRGDTICYLCEFLQTLYSISENRGLT